MKVSNPAWKETLAREGALPADLGREIDIFETEIELRRQGKIDEVPECAPCLSRSLVSLRS